MEWFSSSIGPPPPSYNKGKKNLDIHQIHLFFVSGLPAAKLELRAPRYRSEQGAAPRLSNHPIATRHPSYRAGGDYSRSTLHATR